MKRFSVMAAGVAAALLLGAGICREQVAWAAQVVGTNLVGAEANSKTETHVQGTGQAKEKRAVNAHPARQIAGARALIVKIPPSRFARGKRVLVIRAASAAARVARTKKPCPALAAADRVLSILESPRTWRGQHVPLPHTRKPTSLLRLAGHELLLRAGPRCAREPKKKRLAARPAAGGDFRRVPPPEEENEQGEGVVKPLRRGHLRVPKKLGRPTGPIDPAPPIGPVSPLTGTRGETPWSTTRPAVDPLTFFRFSDALAAPSGGVIEPTVAIGRNVVWYTGNVAVALSTDAGRTFTSFNPSNVLPDAGRAFCCDQLVSYSPYVNLFVWVSQYWCQTSCLTTDSAGRTICPPQSQPNGSNRIRIAVATPEDLIANASDPRRAWTYWDITPQLLGQPANAWFDRSDLSVNAWNMNWTVDVICGNRGSVLGRISLAELARRGTVNLSWIVDDPARMQAAQGQWASTTYFTGNNADSQARIWSWAPFSGTLFAHVIDHTSVPRDNFSVNGTDRVDWYNRYGIFPGAVESSTVSGSTLYLAQGAGRSLCTANCNTDSKTLVPIFDRPAVLITRYDVNSWRLLSERWLWNPTFALGWPALATNGGGEVGIVLHASDNGHNARPVAGFLTPEEQFVFALPEGLPYVTGDYYSLRPGRTPLSFVATAETVQNDPAGVRLHWDFIEYGHGRAP